MVVRSRSESTLMAEPRERERPPRAAEGCRMAERGGAREEDLAGALDVYYRRIGVQSNPPRSCGGRTRRNASGLAGILGRKLAGWTKAPGQSLEA